MDWKTNTQTIVVGSNTNANNFQFGAAMNTGSNVTFLNANFWATRIA